jgi:hypothetical protein
MENAVVCFFMFGYSVECFAMLSRHLLSVCRFSNKKNTGGGVCVSFFVSWLRLLCFLSRQVGVQTAMAPPATGNGRRTRRSARRGGRSDESEAAPPSDSDGEEEQPEEASNGTQTSSQEDNDGGETVGTATNTVAAVLVTEETVGADAPSTIQVTSEQSLSKHEHDVGSLLSIDNCRELARKRAMEDLFSTFKFPPKDKDTILLYQIKLMEKLGYTLLATHHWNFSKKIWPELVSVITEGLRCRRSTITEALDKRVVGTVAKCLLLVA